MNYYTNPFVVAYIELAEEPLFPTDWKAIDPSITQEEIDMSAPELWWKLTSANLNRWYSRAEHLLTAVTSKKKQKKARKDTRS